MNPNRLNLLVPSAQTVAALLLFANSTVSPAEEDAPSALPVWLLYEAKKAADSNRYFDPAHIDIVIPESLWPDATSSSMEHPIPIDFDNDGLMDLFLEQAAPNPNPDLYGPSNVVGLAYKQERAGVYQLATREIFGVDLVEKGDLSRKWVTADLNGDGYVDVLPCLMREDGREMSYEQGYLNWSSEQKLIISNGDGTYRVDALSGDPIYQHGCATAKMQDGSQHIIYGVGPGTPARVFKYQNGQPVTVNGYPDLRGWDERAFTPNNSSDINYSKYLMSTLSEVDDPGVRVFEQVESSWIAYDTYRFGEKIRQVDFTWHDNPGVQQGWLYRYKGSLRMGVVVSDSCELRLSPSESVFVIKIDTTLVPEDFTEPVDGDSLEWDYVYTALAMRNGAIEELDLLPEENDYPMGFSHLCGDMTGDGLGDLSSIQLHGGSEVSFYKNNGQGGLVRTEIKGLEAIEILIAGTVTIPEQVRLVDINGDNIGDWLQASKGTLRINFGIKPQ
ncbi:FG-GAP repeat domain-containing protein [Porticoccus sp.]